jgi:hypothetical protein
MNLPLKVSPFEEELEDFVGVFIFLALVFRSCNLAFTSFICLPSSSLS